MKDKILFGLSILLGLLMINGGLDKFLHYMPTPENMSDNFMKTFTAMNDIGWLMPLVAIGELLGGILLIWPKTRALGAIVLFPIVLGILAFNIVTEPSGLPIALVILGVILWVIYENRAKYMPMIQK